MRFTVMLHRVLGVILFSVVFLLSAFKAASAGSAVVLPKGVSGVNVIGKFYFPIDERFDPDGNVEDVAADFNASLNSNVFAGLSQLEDPTVFGPFALPPGSASLGNTVVSFEYDLKMVELFLGYGITDNLTVGTKIPYVWAKNSVRATVDTSRATAGKNSALNTLAPLTVPGTVPVTDEDVQDLIGGGLDVNGDGTIDIAGFGFKRFQSWSDQGFSDIEVLARYRYLKTEDVGLAFTGGARFPTGRVNDPDNLVDVGFGCGCYALLFRLNSDFVISNLWKTEKTAPDFETRKAVPTDVLVLNFTFKYDLVLPDEQELRVPGDPNRPVTNDKETVDRDIGDVFQFEVSTSYTPAKGLSLAALYKYGFALKNDVSGDLGLNYEALEVETGATQHVYIFGLSYSTVPMYLEKKFPVPITASIAYRNRFAGSHNVFKSQYIAFGFQVLF